MEYSYCVKGLSYWPLECMPLVFGAVEANIGDPPFLWFFRVYTKMVRCILWWVESQRRHIAASNTYRLYLVYASSTVSWWVITGHGKSVSNLLPVVPLHGWYRRWLLGIFFDKCPHLPFLLCPSKVDTRFAKLLSRQRQHPRWCRCKYKIWASSWADHPYLSTKPSRIGCLVVFVELPYLSFVITSDIEL